jgi:sulfoxide reductase heme-binding subunit YedZ
MIVAATLGPTPFWYATRGSGFTALVLLTASVALGLVTSVRWTSPRWPRFFSQSLHRNISLFALFFLLIHIATSIIDPFAGLSVRDALIPVGANYRPLWLGLGVIGAELFAAVLITSLVRHRLGFALWRAVHLLAYVSWPVAVLHGIGTGTDTKAVWAILLVVACVGVVVAGIVWRLAIGWPAHALLRAVGMLVSLGAVGALTAWTASGPLQPGWARAAGTPANLLTNGGAGTGPATTTSPSPAQPALAAGLDDSLAGTVQRAANAVTVTLTDQRDPAIQVTIVAGADGSGTLSVYRSGQTICTSAASIGSAVSGQCGAVLVNVQVFTQGPTGAVGTLTTQKVGE